MKEILKEKFTFNKMREVFEERRLEIVAKIEERRALNAQIAEKTQQEIAAANAKRNETE